MVCWESQKIKRTFLMVQAQERISRECPAAELDRNSPVSHRITESEEKISFKILLSGQQTELALPPFRSSCRSVFTAVCSLVYLQKKG